MWLMSNPLMVLNEQNSLADHIFKNSTWLSTQQYFRPRKIPRVLWGFSEPNFFKWSPSIKFVTEKSLLACVLFVFLVFKGSQKSKFYWAEWLNWTKKLPKINIAIYFLSTNCCINPVLLHFISLDMSCMFWIKIQRSIRQIQGFIHDHLCLSFILL